MKYTQYDIIQSDSLEHVEQLVSGRLKNGWELAGGLSVINIKCDEITGKFTDSGEPRIFYIQAVYK